VQNSFLFERGNGREISAIASLPVFIPQEVYRSAKTPLEEFYFTNNYTYSIILDSLIFMLFVAIQYIVLYDRTPNLKNFHYKRLLPQPFLFYKA